jgi:hypothetical protein
MRRVLVCAHSAVCGALLSLDPSLLSPKRMPGEAGGSKKEQQSKDQDTGHDDPSAFHAIHGSIQQLNECC